MQSCSLPQVEGLAAVRFGSQIIDNWTIFLWKPSFYGQPLASQRALYYSVLRMYIVNT